MIYYPKLDSYGGNKNIKVELGSSDYATKSDVKKATSADYLKIGC